MFNRVISLLLVTTLYAAAVNAEEQQTIYIQADNIVPYQEPSAVGNELAPPQPNIPAMNATAIGQDEIAPTTAPTATETYDHFVPATASPADATPGSAPALIEAETQTHLWLKLQASGAIAGTRYTTPGQTATHIYQRYLKSFTHPIPEHFSRESSGGSGSGSSSSR